MKSQFRHVVFFALLMSFALAGSLYAQTDERVQDVKRFFSGQRMLVTFRNGGPVYGTYFFLDVHFCPSGRYMTFGQSRKQTVLNNEQVNSWREDGVWDIVGSEEGMVLRYLSSSGERNAVPVRLLPDGRVSLGDGVSVVRRGSAQCR